MNYYGQIDITKVSELYKKQPGIFKRVNFKDGEHIMLNVSFFGLPSPDKFGNTVTIKASCPVQDRIDELKSTYYLGNFKESKKEQHQETNSEPEQQAPAEQQTYVEQHESKGELPF